MRILIAAALGCALMIGVASATSAGAPERGPQLATELSCSATDSMDDSALDREAAYRCQGDAPLCQRASQCEAFCAGGAPVCFQGCCSCAS